MRCQHLRLSRVCTRSCAAIGYGSHSTRMLCCSSQSVRPVTELAMLPAAQRAHPQLCQGYLHRCQQHLRVCLLARFEELGWSVPSCSQLVGADCMSSVLGTNPSHADLCKICSAPASSAYSMVDCLHIQKYVHISRPENECVPHGARPQHLHLPLAPAAGWLQSAQP